MSSNYWIATTTGNFGDATNWSLGTVPVSSDDVKFLDASSAQTCNVNVSATFNSINFTGYDGTFNMSTQTLTCATNWTDSTGMTKSTGTSLVHFTGTGTITSHGQSFYDIDMSNSGATFTIADPWSGHNLTTIAMTAYTNAGTTLTSSGNLTFGGTGTMNFGTGITMNGAGGTFSNSRLNTDTGVIFTLNGNTTINANTSFGLVFGGIILGSSVTVNINCNAFANVVLNASGPTTPIQLGSNAILNINAVYFYLNISGSLTTWTLASGATLNGGGSNTNYIKILTDSITVSVGPISSGGKWIFIDNGTSPNSIFNQAGNFGSTNPIELHFQHGGTFNTNNYSINVSSNGGTVYSGGTGITNFGSSIVRSTFIGNTPNTACYLNFQTSQWSDINPHGWTFGSNNIVDPGTFKFTITTYGDTIISAGKSFYDIVDNHYSGNTVIVDNLNCHNFTSGSGNNPLIVNSVTVTVSGNVLFQGTASINFNSSNWNVAGNWTFAAGNVIQYGITTVTFTKTATITSAGHPFNYVVINAPTYTITQGDNLLCHGYQNIAGTLNQNGKKFAVTGDWINVNNQFNT
jgi:hypothetical protein